MKKLWESIKEHYELIGYVVLTALLFVACFVDAFAWIAAVYTVLFAGLLHNENKIVGLLLFVHCFYAIFFYHKVWGISLDIVLVGILTVILLVLYLVRIFKREQKLNWKTLIPVGLFLVYVALPFHECTWIDFFAMVFFYVLVYVVFEERRRIDFRHVVRLFVWSLVLSCVFSLLRNVSPILAVEEPIYYLGKMRFQGLSYHPNTLAKVLILAISAMLILKYKNKISWTEFAFAVIPMFLFGYLTISRSFILTVAAALIIFTILYVIQRKAKALAFVGITLALICAVGGMFWGVTKIYFERIVDKSVGPAEARRLAIDVNGDKPMTDLATAKYNDYFDYQTPEWQQDTLAGKNFYDPGRLGLQELYWRDWSSSAQTIWLGRGISRPLMGQMSAHNLFLQELWKHGLVGYMFYLAIILCSINWKKLKRIGCYLSGLVILIPYVLFATVEQCLLDYIAVLMMIAAFGYLGELADTANKSVAANDHEDTLYESYIKRLLDVIFSGLGLIVLSPLMLIIAFLSKIFIRGKVIYAQPRPGKNGKIFKLYKFRSMSDKRGPSGALLPDAERMTKFGKILRRLSLDELPQLVNILRGDMSIVGPRPRLVSDMIFYNQDVFLGYRLRPGLTGLDQVSGGRSHSAWETIFQKNLEYQQHVTFWGDVKVILLTVLVLFKNDSASCGAEAAQRDYYYDVYLLRTKQISQEQYDLGHTRAAKLIAENGVVEYQPDLHQTTEQPVSERDNDVAREKA